MENSEETKTNPFAGGSGTNQSNSQTPNQSNPKAGKTSLEMQQHIELQLHEQYAINNNANFGMFLSLLTACFVLFGALGYAFISNYQPSNFDGIRVTPEHYHLLAMIVSGCLSFLAALVLTLGYSHRRDQIVVYRIRKKYYSDSQYTEIFGRDGFLPTGKDCCNYIPDTYNLFYILFLLAQLFVLASCACICENCCCCCCSFITIVLQFLFIIITIISRFCMYCKYKDFAAKHRDN